VEIQAKKGRPFLRQWVQEGWLTATPGEVIDHGLIRREINELRQRFAFTEIGFDARSATQVASQLAEEDGFTMVDVRQGTMTLSEPSKLFEASILERKARATGRPGGPNPVMRWMVGNATKRTDANMNIAPDKKRSKDKIDGISRVVGELEDAKPTGSYLETESMVTL
jgi:phage terminase large subunit-like protein